MQCCFCKFSDAIHLDLNMPLCQRCLELRDFQREIYPEYEETKDQHGMGLVEYMLALLPEK